MNCKQIDDFFVILNMEQQLTHELLRELEEKGYTMLVGENQQHLDDHVYTPVKWDVEAFLESLINTTYDQHAIVIIEEMFKVREENLANHKVIVGLTTDRPARTL